MKRKTKTLIILLTGVLLIQFIDTTPKISKSETQNDFINQTNANPKVAAILKENCYDCHSNETNYPLYSKIAPLSWWINHHIEEGREELNFSEYGGFTLERKEHKIKECIEYIEEKEMPLASYELIHGNLNVEDRQILIDFFKGLK